MRLLRVLVILNICLCLAISNVSAQEVQEGSGTDQLIKRIDELEKEIIELRESERARRKLEITQEEKVEKEKEVLDAVSREYTLDPKHSLGIDYSLSYSYSPSDQITNQLVISHRADHTVKHDISVSYGILDNLSMSMGIPFVYRYNEYGTDEELDETDIGDIHFGVGFQPYRSEAGEIRTTCSLGVTLPTGRSPYEINTDTELSTGSGKYSFSAGASFSKQVDPVVFFWKIGYSHSLDLTGLDYIVSDTYTLEGVNPGDSYSVSLGLAYAMSYSVSMNMSFGYSYGFSSTYSYKELLNKIKSGDSASGSFSIGVGYKIARKTTISISLGYGLTGSGFTLTTRIPFNFVI